MSYNVGFIDPRAQQTRTTMLQGIARDFSDKSLRWALHMSEEEANWLERNNPDTLGHTDIGLRKGYWKHFASSPESKPYRMREKI